LSLYQRLRKEEDKNLSIDAIEDDNEKIVALKAKLEEGISAWYAYVHKRMLDDKKVKKICAKVLSADKCK